MTRLQRNILANLVGRGWSNILNLLVIPLYLRFVGIEAYGIIGITATLQSFTALADLGLGITLNRELARLSTDESEQIRRRTVLRTLEVVYWGSSIVAGILVLLLARPLALHWVKANRLPTASIITAVRLSGIIIALQLPTAFYQGGLLGLEKQTLTNAIQVAAGTLRTLGGALVLWKISPTIEALLYWQAGIAALQALVSYVVLWNSLGGLRAPAAFDRKVLSDLWRFAAANSVNGLVALAMSELDSVLLSGLLPLAVFGYYSLAGTVAGGLWSIIVPLNGALFPRFVQLFELRSTDRLMQLYHTACQLMAVLLLPLAALLSIFAAEILLLWTGNPATAAGARLPMMLLVAGTAIAGLSSIPAYVQTAAGRPQLIMYYNACVALLNIPLLLFIAPRYGSGGAAAVWVAVNAGQLIVMSPMIFRSLNLPGLAAWSLRDVAIPVCVVVLTGMACRFLIPASLPRYAVIGCLCVSWAAMSVSALMSCTRVRRHFVEMVERWWPILRGKRSLSIDSPRN